MEIGTDKATPPVQETCELILRSTPQHKLTPQATLSKERRADVKFENLIARLCAPTQNSQEYFRTQASRSACACFMSLLLDVLLSMSSTRAAQAFFKSSAQLASAMRKLNVLVQHPTLSGQAAALRGQAYAAMQSSVAGVQVAQAHLHKPFRRSIQCRWCSTHTLRLQPLPFKYLRQHSPAGAAMRLLVAGLCVASVSAGHQTHRPGIEHKIPGLTYSGYLTVDPDAGSKLFYMFYEAQERADAEQPPICLWLQAGTSPQLLIVYCFVGQKYYIHQPRGCKEGSAPL